MATRRYKVILTTVDTGKHEFTRRASNPIDAMLKVLKYLGMDGLYEPPFQIFVQPIGPVRP